MTAFLTAILSVALAQPLASTPQVVEVRRAIPLSDTEIPYRDYIIATQGVALKRGQSVIAKRKINIKDVSGTRSWGELDVPVGRLQVIAVYSGLAVARETQFFSREKIPLIEQPYIMSGDLIDVANFDPEK